MTDPTPPDRPDTDPARPDPAEPDATDPDPSDGASTRADGSGPKDPEELPSAALAAIARGQGPPPPPKRTGVFFDTDDLRTYVGGLLRAILGGYEVDAFGNFTFVHEGARVFVTIAPSPIGPQVGVFSVTNLGLDLSPELARFLLTTNHTLGFGAFSYDSANRSVWLRDALLGTTLDGPELQNTVAAVATTAARFDHTIQARFGGRTFADAPDELQRGVHPPRVDEEGGPPNASGYL